MKRVRFGIANCKLQIAHCKVEISDLRSAISNLRFRISDFFRISRFGFRIFLLLLFLATAGRAEELWLHDGSRTWGLVQRVKDDTLVVLLPTGQERDMPLEDIISIRFLGRDPLLVQVGTQEFRFVNGGTLRGQILGNRGDLVSLQTAVAGKRDVSLSHAKGFVALPLAGFTGRKAEELVESQRGDRSPNEDTVLDRQGGT